VFVSRVGTHKIAMNDTCRMDVFQTTLLIIRTAIFEQSIRTH
jgi:hypothetical protein